MGHIINPVTTRLGLNTFWSSRWTLNNNYNYSKLFKKNIFFFQFINWFFQKKPFTSKNIIFSHYHLYLNSNNNIYLNLYHFIEAYGENRSRAYFRNVFKLLRTKRKYRFSYNLLVRKYSMFTQGRLLMLYWNMVTKLWSSYVYSANLGIQKINIHFINLTFRNVNAHIILKYIRLRLISKYSLNYILKPILRDLHLRMRHRKILGYKILCAGRFTRKQIAAKMWFKQGATSVNNFENLIKYSQIKVRLKYGVCGIKMWINYGNPKGEKFNQTLELGYPLIKSFKFKKLSLKSQEYDFFLNSATLYFTSIFGLKSKRFQEFDKYMKNLFYIKFYSLFIRFLFKEMQIFLKKRKIKFLRYTPFITLYRNNSRKINIKLNYTNFFLNQTKYFTYK